MTEISRNFSKPIKHGQGYVIDEQRGDIAIRSHIMPSYKDALRYRSEKIEQARIELIEGRIYRAETSHLKQLYGR